MTGFYGNDGICASASRTGFGKQNFGYGVGFCANKKAPPV